jgi:hypothetical protein
MNYHIDALVSDRSAFNAFVYTPLQEAITELKKRREDSSLATTIATQLPAGLPSCVNNNELYAFLSRDLATPNYELRRFLSIIDALGELSPIFWEYYGDKYTPNMNETKYYLGNMAFYIGTDKTGNERVQKMKVVDFNTCSGKKFSEVTTLWNQSFIDFHHELITETYFAHRSHEFRHAPTYFDASQWYKDSGEKVELYYEYIFYLFITHGILFENFLIEDEREREFVKNVFLPAFIRVYEKTGYKPLIVALEPTPIEGKHFWMYYPENVMAYVKNKLGL